VIAADQFIAAATAREGLEFLDVRLAISAPFPGLGLTAAGVLVLNPPYRLREELDIVMPVLLDALAEGEGSAFQLRDTVQ
jgi:23S rRNA (adenine2030-N6)-methyltransferase